ncbi:MAG: sulfatase-like hydrolase/transferase [Victivallales bacterium]|nr:sulfatase-like hydrolase/transferase [Victivallales bacterium]
MKNRKPNILFLLSDQHTPSVMGCYGNGTVQTPNLDRLANEGVVFDGFYCNSPLCVPSRMSMLTGRYPWKIDVLKNQHTLDSRIPTFAHMVAGAGYRTALAGRMHFVGDDQRHGFQERVGGDFGIYAYHAVSPTNFAPLNRDGCIADGTQAAPLLHAGSGDTETIELDRRTNAAAREWIDRYVREDGAHPFLLTVGYFSPHCPFIAPPEYFKRYEGIVGHPDFTEGDYEQLHPIHKTYADICGARKVPPDNLDRAVAAYYGLVNYLDDLVGEILATLEAHGLLDNTIVIYSSDHGEMLGAHGRWHKDCFFDQSARVPFIVRFPDGSVRRRIAEPSSLVDLLPTLVDLTGAPGHTLDLDGRSLVPLMRGKACEPSIIRCEDYLHGACNRMIRLGDIKLCFYSGYDRQELYDLAADPGETHNRIDDPNYASMRETLTKLLFSDGWHTNVLADTEARLQKIGFHDLSKSAWQGTTLIKDGVVTDVPGYDIGMLDYKSKLV